MKPRYLFIAIIALFSVQLSAQCYTDRHNTSWKDSWISCSPSQSPNPNRGIEHWLLLDLSYQYKLGQIHIWNSNVPDSTDRGIQNLLVDYSDDGISWNSLGDYTLAEASGSAFNEGQDAQTFDGITTRYILLTGLSNFGGTCYSLSEIKIEIQDIVVPIELLSFDIKCEAHGITAIKWETTNEVNNDYFEIEQSENGFNWEVISRIDASTNTEVTHKYYYEIRNIIPTKKYYRLVQIDRDGNKTHFATKVIDCHLGEENIYLFPNPANDFIELSIDTDVENSISIEMYNALGMKLSVFSIDIKANHKIDISKLLSGQYYMIVYLDSGAVRKNFVVID